jgi:hypothetical protein
MRLKSIFEAFALPDGTIIETHMTDGRLHREDGPAWQLVAPNGTRVEMYFKNGVLDRIDGPAISVGQTGSGVDAYFRSGASFQPRRQ